MSDCEYLKSLGFRLVRDLVIGSSVYMCVVQLNFFSCVSERSTYGGSL